MNEARYKYLERICQLVEQGEQLVLVSSDYAAPTLDEFRIKHKDRYVSVGIAEQNLIQVSCGLSLSGQRVIAYGMAPFPCIRTFDQIRNAVAIMNAPISIVSAGVGFAIPEFGVTHYCTEDLALMRTIPNVRIINLTDEIMAQKVAELSLTTENPLYIRIDKYSGGIIYKAEDIDFEKGFSVVRGGTDVTVVTSGYYTNRMIRIAEDLEKEDISVKVIDLFSIPFDEQEFMKETVGQNEILSVEEHVLQGGLGSLLVELYNDKNIKTRVRRMGITYGNQYNSDFGSREYFIDKFGLNDDSIKCTIRSMMKEEIS